MDEFKVLLQAVLDSSGIGKSDISEVQKVLDKYHLNLAADLNKAELIKTVKQILPELEAELKKVTGIDIKIDDKTIEKTINQVIGDNRRLQTELEKTAKKAEETAQRTKNALNQKLDKIQVLVGDNGDTTAQIQTITNSFTKLGLSSETVEKKMSSVNTEFTQLKSIMESGDDIAIVAQFDKLQSAIGETKNDLSMLRSEYSLLVTNQQRLSKADAIEAWNLKNTRATKSVRAANQAYIDSLRALNSQMTKMQFNEIVNGFKTAENSMRSIGKLGASVKDQLTQARDSFLQWISVSSAVMGLVYQIQKIPKAVKETNDAITDLTMATGASKTQIESYMDSYSQLGDKLSATVIDITESGTEWLKQGQSIADTETLITDAIVLSKIGKLSTADSTKYLTSAMKGYNVAAKDTLDVVDKLSAVDLISATDVGGLAEAMSQVANNANLAGVGMDKLLGYAAVVGEVTQSSMSEVGTSLNAVFSRMGNIKLARLKDYQNSGEDLSNVETVLKGVGISLRDSMDTFRDFDEVLDETGANWGTYSDVQQRAIASAFAGVNHMENFLVLMNNYDTALRYTDASLNSSGQAMDKFNAYQESTTAHLEKMKNAGIEFANTMLDSGLVNFFIDFGTALTKAGTGIVDFLTPLGTLGAGIGSILGAKDVGKTLKFS
ncbi:phage tail tape measure protein [Konateibacter massiliensis]|uniref:phage tail tape measure protein n=1 Tax=Konateibacter massiliensis TaxID=2002841 RepID=UPI000C145101|nr:phage tail tape measure protein [Konateibacter massiliensis]